ncbi:DNA primase [Planctomycetaceae bacterium SH139]
MSSVTDFDLKERIRSAVDIVDVIGRQMELRRQGRNFVARCPWHDDRRPSLLINQERQTWRCWVCDIGGDVFSYIMRRDGVTFPEALQLLGEQAGIPVDQLRGQHAAEPGSKDDKATLLAALRWAVDQFTRCFAAAPEAAAARQYAESRGITPASIEKFQIGYAPESWDWLLKQAEKAGFSGPVMHACGLAEARKTGEGFYDMFRNRLLFPIFDLPGRPIALGGRVLPGGEGHGGKYINGRETLLFSKSKQLYGLNWARDAIGKQNQVLVMEGYTDVLAANQAGIETAVAVLGTALGPHHIRILKRFVDSVVLVLDGDQAGQRRADEVLELFVGADVDLRVLTLPDGLDPADFLDQHGVAAFNQAVAEAPDAIDHKLQRLIAGVDLIQDTHRATKALETVLGVLAKGPTDKTDLRLQQTLVRLGRTFTVPVETLEQRLREIRQGQRRYQTPAQRQAAGSPTTAADNSPPQAGKPTVQHEQTGIENNFVEQIQYQPATDSILRLDRELFEALIERPDFVALALESIDENWLSSDSARELLRAYQSQEFAGLSLDVRDLMLTIENETLKNQLVAMDSRVQEKSGTATQSPEMRFSSILERYRAFQVQAETRQRLAQLDQGTVPEDVQLDVLGELFAAQRLRHGMTGQPDRD